MIVTRAAWKKDIEAIQTQYQYRAAIHRDRRFAGASFIAYFLTASSVMGSKYLSTMTRTL
jgi:hypothetical protein